MNTFDNLQFDMDDFDRSLFNDIEEMVDGFCRACHVYCLCFNRNKSLMISYMGDTKERQILESMVTYDLQRELLGCFHNFDRENVISFESRYPHLMVNGVAIRDSEGNLLGIGILVGIDETKIPEDEFMPAAVLRTNREAFDFTTAHFETVTRHYFVERAKSLEAEEKLKHSTVSEDKLQESMRRNEATAEVFKLLESEADFSRLANEIVHLAGDYLQISSSGLIQMENDDTEVSLVAEYCLTGVTPVGEGFTESPVADLPFLNGRPYTISSDTVIPDEFGRFFSKFNLTAGIFLPLMVNDKAKMYLCFAMKEKSRRWSVEEIKFLNDVKRVLQSILSKRITKNSLASSYAALEAILGNVGCGVAVLDAKNQRRLYTNEAYKHLLNNVDDRGELERMLNRDGEGLRSFFAKQSGHWIELTFARINWVDGRPARLCTLYDVTQLIDAQNRIETASQMDELTGLFNRKRCEEDLQGIMKNAVREATGGAMLLLGLDDFKNINEGLGHVCGDELLRQVSEALKQLATKGVTVYRSGGDEFVLIIAPEKIDRLTVILNQVQEAFHRTWLLQGAEYYCTMSMGVVRFPEDGLDPDALFRRADMALGLAKSHGKDRIEYYNSQGPDNTVRRLDMEKCMRQAVSEGCRQFEVYYQPVMDLSNQEHRCCGAEALVRWDSPELGFLEPNDFIPLAEYLGLIIPIGEHVLIEAARKCKYWNDFGHPDYKVNVNLSVVQLLQHNIVDVIRHALEETGINPHNLTLEVTESLAINDLDAMESLLLKIKELGVRVALDDFGTGYSSLSHIRKMPIDVIKIDRCFVTDLGRDDFSNAFVRTVSELADSLSMNVCVEGVENTTQCETLDHMNVDLYQGYLFDKPLPSDEFEMKYVN